MPVDLTQIENVMEIIKEIESVQNRLRKDHAYKARQIMEGAQAQYVKAELARLYPKTHELMRVSDISLLKKVVSKIARAYKEDPLRSLDSEIEIERYSMIAQDANFNKQFRIFDKYFVRDKHAALWVNKMGDKFNLVPLAAFEFDVVMEDNTGEISTVILSYDKGEFKEYALWSDTRHVKVRAKGTFDHKQGMPPHTAIAPMEISFVPIPGNPGNVNPLGIIPFSYRSNGDGRGYPVPSPLPGQSTTMNVSLSDLQSAAAKQGHGHLVRKVVGSQQTQELHAGLHTVIDLRLSENPDDPQPDVSYINANPDLTGQREALAAYVRGVLDENGISGGEFLTGNVREFTSGLDRAIAQADVTNQVEAHQGEYANVEDEIFQIVKAYQEIENKDRFVSEKLAVSYRKPKVLISDAETLANIEKQLKLGLIEEWEKFKIMNPNLSEEECRSKLERINKEKLERQKMFGTEETQTPPEDEDGEDR